MLILSHDIRMAIANRIGEIQNCAKQAGFQSMRYDGIKKVLQGLTTLEEVNRAAIIEN